MPAPEDSAGEFGLSGRTLERLRAVLSRYPQVRRALIYGSRALGTHRIGSDIDLALDAPTLSFTDFLRLEQEIDDLLLPYQMDLSRLADIEDGPLRDHIDRAGRLLWAPSEASSC